MRYPRQRWKGGRLSSPLVERGYWTRPPGGEKDGGRFRYLLVNSLRAHDDVTKTACTVASSAVEDAAEKVRGRELIGERNQPDVASGSVARGWRTVITAVQLLQQVAVNPCFPHACLFKRPLGHRVHETHQRLHTGVTTMYKF